MTREVTREVQRAYEIREEIIAHGRAMKHSFRRLGELFNEVLDRSLWKLSGSDSFPAYCADPEIGFSAKTAYQYADLYRVFVLEGHVPDDRLLAVGPSNLEIIKRRFRETKDMELIDKAEHLSRGDLLEEMGKARKEGRREKSRPQKEYEAGRDAGFDFDAWKMSRGCCTCGEPATAKSHIPKTRGAGARESDWFPQCRDCHAMFHRVGVDTFLEKYKYPLFAWIHDSMFAAREGCSK